MGERGAGKDTAAQALISRGWLQQAFGSGIYDECAAAFNVPRALFGKRETKETPLPELMLAKCADQDFVRTALLREDVTVGPNMDPMLAPRSPRFIMQTWGTEYRRQQQGEDYWVKQVEGNVLQQPAAHHAFTDVRELLEIELVKAYGGPLVRIIDPALKMTDATTMAHSSEVNVRDYPADLTLINHKKVENIPVLQAQVLAFVNQWYANKQAA